MVFAFTSLPLNFYTFYTFILLPDVVVASDLKKNGGGSTDLAERRSGWADLHASIHPPSICIYMYVIRGGWHSLWHGKMVLKICHLVFSVVFGCCTTLTTVGDHSGGHNDDSIAKFIQQSS